MNHAMRFAGGTITVGDHVASTQIFGLTVDLDIVWSSLIAAAIVLGMGFWMRHKVTSGFIPIAITLFMFILICNWLEILPNNGHDWVPPPTGDVNLPLACALTVILWVHVESVRARGVRGYLRHYGTPYKALIPINIIEELTKPITLTFRLFGNIFSGSLMVVVMASLLPWYGSLFGQLIWKPFDLGIGLIQAFIFALLAILYFGMAMSTEEH